MPRKIKTWSDVAKELSNKPPELHPTPVSPIITGENEEQISLDQELAFHLSDLNDKEAIPYSSEGQINIGTVAGDFNSLLKGTFPSSRRGQIKRAYDHFERDDLLNGLIKVKEAFTVSGLSIDAKPPADFSVEEENQDVITKFKIQLDNVTLNMDIDKLVDDLLHDWYLTDNMILYWRVEPGISGQSSDASVPRDEIDPPLGIPGVYDICSLNPGDIDWDNSLGQDILVVDIPSAVSKRVNDAILNRGKTPTAEIIEELITSGIGRKWIEAILNHKDQVKLLREDGDNWLIRTRARKHHGLSCPSMRTIFTSLEMRRLFIDGEFSAAFVMKHFIMLIKAGESVSSGPLAGQTKTWLRPKDAKALMAKFSTVNKAMRAVVNHTVKVDFVFPPTEMFDPAKFANCEGRIFNWSGVIVTIMSGKDNDYGSGFIGIKRMLAEMAKARKELKTLFINFFRHPTIIEKIQTPQGFLVALNFDENILKEPRQLLEEAKFLFQSCISDPRTAAKELGRDPERLKSETIQSRSEEKNLQVWSPVGEGQAKFVAINSGGRPANPGTTPSEETRTQPPAGQFTKNV